MKIKLTLLTFATILLLLLSMWLGSSVRPVAWEPDEDKGLVSPFEMNDNLGENLLYSLVTGKGPEDLFIDEQGWLFTGLESGEIIKIKVNSDAPAPFLITNTLGRPLGIRKDKNGDLIVADADKGLLKVSMDGRIQVLEKYYGQDLFKFLDHLDIADDGMIYFSDASTRFSFNEYKYDFIEASMTGRVFSYNPATKLTRLLVDNLYFANGVAVSKDQEYLLINETGKARILKHYLRGPKTGQTEVFIDQLPGLPDNINLGDNGIYWVAINTLRDPLIDSLAQYPFIRRLIGAIPHSWLKASHEYGMVIGINEQAEIVHNLQTSNAYTQITSAVPFGASLYLGSLVHDDVGVVELQR